MATLTSICDCCGSSNSYDVLQMFNDGCLKIVDGSKTTDEFCFTDFAFPVDGSTCATVTLNEDGGTHIVFDNNIVGFTVPEPDANFPTDFIKARGVMIRVAYPTLDLDGETIPIQDKKAQLLIEDAYGIISTQPFYDLYMHFVNPHSNIAADVINKITVVNPNSNYRIKVHTLVILGKSV
jgi:hypothetical protein